ncbi:undecaprenyl-diphosphate phosphatase [Sulfurimonas sp. MAG313]|nr:undecaprenyl-diphosphate phosphatase [Sulfurimonas sp. MAG313]MDF1880872.1 undecaprenyl-diphosphate phosphatase [Sulfurimonas sp. MAG313]
MTLYEAAILGIVEGITEFLPVSSTAHIALVSQLMGVAQDDFMSSFNIIIQIAPIFSIMLIYFNTLVQSLDIWKKLIASFIPTGIIGFLFHKQIETMFSANSIILWMIATGVFFLIIEFLYSKRGHSTAQLEDVSYKQAISIGFIQALSLIPGVSRSGSTILGGMFLGLKRETSMSFSFLLAIPTMTAASGYTLLKDYDSLSFNGISLILIGFVVSFIVGLAAVKSFLAIVGKYNFTPFGIYLIASGILFGLFGVEL